MQYVPFKTNENEYKLRLSAKHTRPLETELGKSMLAYVNEFGNMGDDMSLFPDVDTIVTILYYSLLANQPDLKRDDVYDIYDEYVDAGGGVLEFIQVLMSILEVSGFFKQAPTTGANKKK
ncbi:DUF6096 family protein [Paenibacillus sp. FSL H3-0333]|uniref:DUF6096 family protein n=1 Tax=Paenibacillus sp. FSL H3-0333 TaxID=2921373 RepID=UPI0030F68D3F